MKITKLPPGTPEETIGYTEEVQHKRRGVQEVVSPLTLSTVGYGSDRCQKRKMPNIDEQEGNLQSYGTDYNTVVDGEE